MRYSSQSVQGWSSLFQKSGIVQINAHSTPGTQRGETFVGRTPHSRSGQCLEFAVAASIPPLRICCKRLPVSEATHDSWIDVVHTAICVGTSAMVFDATPHGARVEIDTPVHGADPLQFRNSNFMLPALSRATQCVDKFRGKIVTQMTRRILTVGGIWVGLFQEQISCQIVDVTKPWRANLG